MSEEKKAAFTVRVPESVRDGFRDFCARTGITVGSAVSAFMSRTVADGAFPFRIALLGREPAGEISPAAFAAPDPVPVLERALGPFAEAAERGLFGRGPLQVSQAGALYARMEKGKELAFGEGPSVRFAFPADAELCFYKEGGRVRFACLPGVSGAPSCGFERGRDGDVFVSERDGRAVSGGPAAAFLEEAMESLSALAAAACAGWERCFAEASLAVLEAEGKGRPAGPEILASDSGNGLFFAPAGTEAAVGGKTLCPAGFGGIAFWKSDAGGTVQWIRSGSRPDFSYFRRRVSARGAALKTERIGWEKFWGAWASHGPGIASGLCGKEDG